MKLIVLLLTCAVTVWGEYKLIAGERAQNKLDTLPKFHFDDISTIPQKLSYYARKVVAMDKKTQMRHDRRYNAAYFKPWHQSRLRIDPNDFGWEVRFVRKNAIYKEDATPIPSRVYEAWIANANYKAIDTKKYKAITLRHCDLKSLPTHEAFYRNPALPGEGFPFDYNQNSALYPNTPLYISHYSRDGKWAFVQSPYAFGWVDIKDMALVDDRFIKRFENGNYAVSIQDNAFIVDRSGKKYSLVKLGTLFPYDRNRRLYLIALRGKNGYARLAPLALGDPGLVAKKPLPFNARNVAKVAKAFYDEPYGWGGKLGCRDCSALTRDFFAPFGIFLRRNSSKQVQDGHMIPIPPGPKSFRKRFILEHAKAFRSLLYVPGHIVLYLGDYKGEPVIFHNYWGIRKKDGTKHITARTIISTTEPGKERQDVKERSKLIHTLRFIVNF